MVQPKIIIFEYNSQTKKLQVFVSEKIEKYVSVITCITVRNQRVFLKSKVDLNSNLKPHSEIAKENGRSISELREVGFYRFFYGIRISTYALSTDRIERDMKVKSDR